MLSNEEITLRIPPQNVEVEEAILGGLLLDPYAIARVVDILPEPEYFYIHSHQAIYQACLSLHKRDRPTDLNMVLSWLRDKGALERCGGASHLADLVDRTVSSVNIDKYAELIADKYRRRQIIKACTEVADMAHATGIESAELMAGVEQRFFELLLGQSQKKGLEPIGSIMTDEFERVEKVSQGELTRGIATGFCDLDGVFQGIQPGELVVVAGRPGMGKSAFAGAIALNVAKAGLPVALFSLEMNGGDVARRLWSAESRIESGRITAGKIAEHEWEPLGLAGARLSDTPLYIDDEQSVSVPYIRTQCKSLMSRHGGSLGLVIVDYLHLMLDGDEERQSQEIGKITRESKRLARELGAPVMMLSQLNRAVESKASKRPMLSDLRSSGCIEQDADKVVFLYRDEYYNPDTPDRNIAEVIIAKHRSGPTGVVKLLFEPEYSQFRSLWRRGA